MTFKSLASFFARLEKTDSRNQKTAILAALFKKAKSEEIDLLCYLSLGRLSPLYDMIEFNMAEKMMVKTLGLAYQKEEKVIRKKYKQLGDLGNTAAFFDRQEKPKSLTVTQVYTKLKEIAQEEGEGSVDRKIKKMAALIDDLDSQSAKYAVRIPLGKLRLGFSDKTILDALSWMLTGDKTKKETIEAAYNVRADVGLIARKIKTKGLKNLKDLKVQLGVPIMPALCQRLPNAKEMIKKMGKVAVEPKYDGQRLSIHFSRKKKEKKEKEQLDFDFPSPGWVRFFTRNLENVTHMFPDLAKALFEEVKAKEAVFDGEAIGVDPKTGRFLPFQETIKRKRKHAIKQSIRDVPLEFFAFDLLSLNGRDLLKKPFEKRRQLLAKMVKKNSQIIKLSPQIITDDPKRLRSYHNQQIKKGLEGVVVKKWQASYDPGKRGYTWVKFKQEKGKHGGGLADTLDCVVMGYNRGKGKRAKFGIGAFLVGVKKGDFFLTVSKIGTGLTDKQWREMKKRAEKVKNDQKPGSYKVPKDLTPDVWCEPKIVVEIEADNITKSPLHSAKYALRFPRLIKFRDDKRPEQATTLKETKKLFKLQG